MVAPNAALVAGGWEEVKQGSKMLEGERREARGGDGTSAIVYLFMYILFLPRMNDAFVLPQERINPRPCGQWIAHPCVEYSSPRSSSASRRRVVARSGKIRYKARQKSLRKLFVFFFCYDQYRDDRRSRNVPNI